MPRIVSGMDIEPQFNRIQAVSKEYQKYFEKMKDPSTSLPENNGPYDAACVIIACVEAYQNLKEFYELKDSLLSDLYGRLDVKNPEKLSQELSKINQLSKELIELIQLRYNFPDRNYFSICQ